MEIVVLGMHRSGTSSVTRILNLMGASLGGHAALMPAASDNSKGFWERQDVMDVNDALLRLRGCTWHQLANLQRHAVSWRHRVFYRAARTVSVTGRLKRIVRELDQSSCWAIKDPRLCLTFGEWKPYLANPRVVLVSRNPCDVARSLRRRQGFGQGVGLALWEHYACSALNQTRDFPRVHVSYERLIADPIGTTVSLLGQLENAGVRSLIQPSARAILDFVDATMDHSSTRLRGEDIPLTSEQEVIAAMLRGEQLQRSSVRVSAPSAQIMEQHSQDHDESRR